MLRDALGALALALRPEQVDALLAYLALLLKWNAVYNLTAIREPTRMLVEHVLDSLAIIPALGDRVELVGARIADIGSGAGLPAIPLAIALPAARITSIEPVGKKAAFQRQCQGELALTNLTIYERRAESVTDPQDVIVSRAFASLPDFIAAAKGMTSASTVLVAMKGRLPADELTALPPSIHAEALPAWVPGLDAQRHLILMRAATAGTRSPAPEATAPEATGAEARPSPHRPTDAGLPPGRPPDPR